MSQQTSWGRRIVEGLVILASILVAFLIDAWWDHRQARALEAEILAATADEFAQNRTELQRMVQENGDDLALVDMFLRASPEWLSRVPVDSVHPYVRALPRTMTFNPIEGAAVVLLQTPVSDSEGLEARRTVSRALRAMADAVEANDRLGQASDRVRARLAVHALRDGSGGLSSVPNMIARVGPTSLLALRDDADLLAAVIDKAHLQRLYVEELEVAAALLDAVGSP